MHQQSIPVLDLQDFLQDSATSQNQFVHSLGQALQDIGFFALVNHGVDAAAIRRAYQAADQFFALPVDIKQAYERPDLQGQRGYTAFGREHARHYAAPDLKEFWHVGQPSPIPDLPANFWPVEVADFRPAMLDLYAQLEHCASHLLAACSLFLEQPPAYLQALTHQGDSILRILHYPTLPTAPPAGSLRAAPHEDINLLTLLCEATAPGLELQQRDGTWLPIQPIPGQLIVDTGDMLQNLTNGLLRSTTHRVVNPPPSKVGTAARFSLPFFIHPHPQADLTPLPACVARSGQPACYPSLTAQAYLRQRLVEIGLA